MELEGFYCPSGWLYVWDASTGAVVTEKDGTAWECSEGEKVTKVKLSPKGAVVALATTAGRVVVQSALRSVDRRLDGLALHHSAHTARITDVCWGYKGIYSCDEAGQIYEFHWKASFAPTLLADVNEPVLQISSRSFTGAYAEDCVLLVVVTARRCLLIDTDTGMVATVAGKGPQEGPVGACFTWGCGDLVVAFPSSVWIIAVTDLAMGVEVKNKVVCENGVQLLAPLRDGRVAGLCGGGVQLISPATGVVEEVACSGVVDAAFTHRGDVVLLLEDGVEWLSVGEKRGGRNAHKKYTNSHFASGAGRRTIPGKVACTAATAAALSIATALCPPYPLSPRKRSRQEAPRQQAPMQPTAFIAPENIEKAKQLSMGMITSASSMWSSVLRMAEEPIPYNVIVIIVASMSAVAVAVPIRRVRKHSRPRVIKTGKKVKEKEATIKDRVKKVHAVREAADLAPEQLVCVQDEEASLYEDRMRCLVDESQRRLLRDYETRVQTLKTESAEVASTTAAIAVVLASWGANPLQARHDEAIEIAVAAATVISVYGCFEMERRFVIRNTHQMCRELTELLLWNVDADIDDIERRAEREQQKQEQEAREHRAAEAREAELMLPAASLSVYRSYEGEEADELLNALAAVSDMKQQTKATAYAAVLGILIHAGVTTQIKRKESMVTALTKWASEAIAHDFLTKPNSPKPQRTHTPRLEIPEEVRNHVPPEILSDFGEELQQACDPLLARHRDALRALFTAAPYEGRRVVYQHQGTPLWKTEWGAGVLQATDPPEWGEYVDGRVLRKVVYNPIDDPDLLPSVSWVWVGEWTQGPWEHSIHGDIWERECGMFSVLRRRRWTRKWYCHRNHQGFQDLATSQEAEMLEFATNAVRDLVHATENKGE